MFAQASSHKELFFFLLMLHAVLKIEERENSRH